VVYRLLELNSEHAAEIYRAYVRQGVTQSELTMIRSAVQRNQLTGSSRFVDVVEAKVGRRIENRDRGRPRK
jgi:putative transposase